MSQDKEWVGEVVMICRPDGGQRQFDIAIDGIEYYIGRAIIVDNTGRKDIFAARGHTTIENEGIAALVKYHMDTYVNTKITY